MYRLKGNTALSASLESEFEKEGQKAVLFSVIASVLSMVNSIDRKISIAGISIDLKEQFLLNGAFCGVALFYGLGMFTTGLRLYGAGWPSAFLPFCKRYIFRKRNKRGALYNPVRAKRECRVLCALFYVPLLAAGALMIPLYVYGVAATMPDLLKISSLVYSTIF
ncbi:hypothetical protein O9X98_25380 [Agrobacterium salinitolerans]|nr:hypothetical protein [Agrobacterium salinitolerans]